jgi:hypothetical protein
LCAKLDRDLVVFFDEADCLIGRSLLSFLSQLRLGYLERDLTPFPRSIALIGLRNIRDYKSDLRPDSESLGSSSPFNVAESLTLSDFTPGEVKTLYAQHTEDTGQVFEDEAVQRAWYWTEGQPWLVNALAREAVDKILQGDRGPSVTAGHIDQAAENLMRRRTAHADSLMARLRESRVIEVMAPVFAGKETTTSSRTNDDILYCLDLGLVKADEFNQLRPANPMYGRLMVDYISFDLMHLFPAVATNIWIKDNRVLIRPLLEEFQKIWRNYGSTFPLHKKNLAGIYDEATHVFFLFAFLQRATNGDGARVELQYPQGRGRVDICVLYQGAEYPIELKVTSDKNPYDRHDSIAQLAGYMETTGAGEGWLMVFDQNRLKAWSERYFWETVDFKGLTIHIVGS